MNSKRPNSIKEVRKEVKKTQLQIALAAGISESYYSMIENGKRRPSVDLAALLSKELSITLDSFFTLYNLTKSEVAPLSS